LKETNAKKFEKQMRKKQFIVRLYEGAEQTFSYRILSVEWAAKRSELDLILKENG